MKAHLYAWHGSRIITRRSRSLCKSTAKGKLPVRHVFADLQKSLEDVSSCRHPGLVSWTLFTSETSNAHASHWKRSPPRSMRLTDAELAANDVVQCLPRKSSTIYRSRARRGTIRVEISYAYGQKSIGNQGKSAKSGNQKWSCRARAAFLLRISVDCSKLQGRPSCGTRTRDRPHPRETEIQLEISRNHEEIWKSLEITELEITWKSGNQLGF